MRPKKHEATGEGDLFRARLAQIINMKHELVQLACPCSKVQQAEESVC
jgi:IS5 family transposase